MMSDSVKILGYFVRPLTIKDVTNTYLEWFDDDEVLRFLEVNKTKKDVNSLKDLINYVRRFEVSDDYLFGIFDNVKHIGNITISRINYDRGTFNMGYLIGDKDYWGKRAGEAGLVSGLRFAFEDLGLRKIFGGIYSKNLTARFLSKKIGFVEEARLKEKGYVDGALDDVIIYTMTTDQWNELHRNKYDFTF